MDPVSTAKQTLQISLQVALAAYKQIALAKANKKQCNRLGRRIKLVIDAVEGLDKLDDVSHYHTGLESLNTTLKDCLAFVTKFANKHWFRKVLLAGTDESKFRRFSNDLLEASELLQLGLTSQQLTNHKQDKKDQAADHKDILKKQDEIIALQEQTQTEIKDFKLSEEEHHDVLLKQVLSIKARLHEFSLNPTNRKPSLPIDSHLIIPHYDLFFKSILAEGSFGHVYLGEWKGGKVAIKTMQNDNPSSQSAFTREVQIMSRLRNSHITQFYGASMEKGHFCLVMEYMEGGSLRKHLNKRNAKYSPTQKCKLALDIAQGLQFLHNQQILHGNLSSSNVLINSDGHAKLTDFRVADIKTKSVMSIHDKPQDLSWLAPELMQRGGKHTTASDVYGFGVLLWEILTGKLPGKIRSEKNRTALPIYKNMPPLFKEILKSCWNISPNQRISLSEIITQLQQFKPDEELSSENIYKKGITAEKAGDLVKAAGFYKQSGEMGYARGLCNYGWFALKGQGGVERNPKLAKTLLTQASDLGLARAKFNLAKMYEKGDGIEKNLQAAIGLFKTSAEAGNKGAQEKWEEYKAQYRPGDTQSYQGNLDSMMN